MMRLIYIVLVNSGALFLSSLLLPGFNFEGALAPILAGFVISVLNIFVRPLLKLLSFPLVFLSGGLFLIVINAFVLFLTTYLIKVMDFANTSVRIDDLLTYLLVAIIFGLANYIIHWFFKE